MVSKTFNKNFWLFAITTAMVLIIAVVSICNGKYSISVNDIFNIITNNSEVSSLTKNVFFTLRLPRTFMAIISGVALGMAGCVYQIIFKNPLASPDIIGIAGGANLGAAISIVAFSSSAMAAITTGSFWGGLLAVLGVMAMVKATHSHSTATYVLAGIVINAMSKALIMTLKYFADSENELAAIEYWEMGSFGNITSTKLLSILPFFLVGLIGLILLRRQIELMSMSDNECKALGVRIRPIRISILVLSTLMVSSVVSVTGLVSFAGLIAPHIARLILKRNNATTMMLSGVVGSFVVLSADVLARTIYSAELPISILTTVIGVPLLVYFMVTAKKDRF